MGDSSPINISHAPERTCFLQAGTDSCGIMLACPDNESSKCALSCEGMEEKRICMWLKVMVVVKERLSR